MKVILTKDKSIKDVSEGYARNYLLPKGLAIIATPQELAKRELNFKNAEIKRKQQEISDKEQIKKLENKEFKIKTDKVGENNKIFGSITAKDIADAVGLKKENILIEKPINILGMHSVPIKIGQFHTKISVIIQES